LPEEEYDWFDLRQPGTARPKTQATEPGPISGDVGMPAAEPDQLNEAASPPQKDFFEFPGPLFGVRISPASSVVHVGAQRTLRALARDRSNRVVDNDLQFHWELVQGDGVLEGTDGEIVMFKAGSEPGLVNLRVIARQRDVECSAEALITVTDSLLPEAQPKNGARQGIPSYTFQKAPGELWRSRYQPEQNVIVINNGHRDFVYASRNKTLKLRYICRLFAKELVVKNFAGSSPAELLERLIELSLYTEENLK
jgi:hypothetical protein